MGYFLDAEKIGLDELQKRIEETDLVPSRNSLLKNIKNNFRILQKKGYTTFADLSRALKNSKNIPSVSEKTGIDPEYLTILRREIESYFPKTIPVRLFDCLSENDIESLEKKGLKNAALLFDELQLSEKRKQLSTDLEVDAQIIDDLFCLVDLTRIQWINPVAAKMLFLAGYEDTNSVAKVNAEKMYDEINKVNRENNFFKGKIGLRDVKRIIKAASYVL